MIESSRNAFLFDPATANIRTKKDRFVTRVLVRFSVPILLTPRESIMGRTMSSRSDVTRLITETAEPMKAKHIRGMSASATR